MNKFGDRDSDSLCLHLGHECGMVDRELMESADEDGDGDPTRLSLLHDQLVLGLFATVDCGDASGMKEEGWGGYGNADAVLGELIIERKRWEGRETWLRTFLGM